MACWFFVNDENESIDRKLDRFKKSFSVDHRFRLNVKPVKLDESKYLVTWSWNNLGEFPDIEYRYSEKDQVHILIDGFISDFGKFGEAASSRTENAEKLLRLHPMGNEFIHELNGSFCILIYDGKKNSLSIFNDRISSRPVWYHSVGQRFYAANFPSTISAIKKEKPGISEVGLWSLLATGRHTGETGLFEGIYNLPSGSLLTLQSNSQLSTQKWFDLKYSPDYDLSAGEWGEKIAGELRNSAQRIKNQYDDIYLFLSGGMDSRVAAAAFGPGTHSVTLTTRENMNSKISERVANRCGISHETVFRNDHWYLDSMSNAALIGSGNYKISHAHFTSLFGRDDKYFEGAFTHGDMLENFNKHYFKIPVNNLNPQTWVKNFNKYYSYSIADFDKLERLFIGDYGKKIRTKWEEYTIDELEKARKVSQYDEDIADTYFRWQNTTVCPTYLMLENIRPFASLVNLMFDNHLLDTLFSIPHEIKSSGNLHNEILRNLYPKLLWIPNSNSWLPPATPEILVDAAKKVRPLIGSIRRKIVRSRKKTTPLVLTEGSWDMLHERYRFDDAYKSEMNDMVAKTDFINFNPGYVSKLLHEFHEGNIRLANEIEHIYSINKLLSLING